MIEKKYTINYTQSHLVNAEYLYNTEKRRYTHGFTCILIIQC